MPYIDIVQPENATGDIKEIYDELIKSRGKIAEVHKIQSLNPESVVKHMELYMTIMFGNSPLKRVQREMIAVVVSKENNCEYCQIHHLEAVSNFWKDEDRSQKLLKDHRSVDLNEVDLALCDFAESLTRNEKGRDHQKEVEKLQNLGIEDRAILDATLVISYFNFVNRIVLGLGVELEENPGGYKYE